MKKLLSKKNILSVVVMAAVYCVVCFMMMNNVLPRTWQALVIRMCYNVILAMSLNLVVGFLGELSLGHAAFYAVGAYSGCFFAINVELPLIMRFIGGLLVGGVCSALVGFLISSSILRLRGDYLAIVTLAFGEIIRSFVKIIPGLGGTSGLTGVPSFESRLQGFTCSFAVVLVTLIVLQNFISSRHGRAIMAIRDNEIAARSVGINVKRYKVLAFVVAAFFAGMAGVVFGFFKTSVEPADFTYNVSIEVLVMVVLGGMGSMFGSIVAACVITALPEILRGADQYRLLIYAVALIAMMLLNANSRFAELKEKFSLNALMSKKSKKIETVTPEKEEK